MSTKMIRFHSNKQIGVIKPDYERSKWFRNGVMIRGLRNQMQVGDLAATYASRFDNVRTLVPITKVEYIRE